MQNVAMKGEKMYKFRIKVAIIITSIILLFGTITSSYAVQTNSNINSNNIVNSSINNVNTTHEEILSEEDSTTSTLTNLKEEQLKTLNDYKKKYGSDTYGIVAYILHLVQVYSIPLGLVGIAFCAIYQYVIGLKRLDIRDKGFNSMIALITIIIICQILPLIFAIVVKSTD